MPKAQCVNQPLKKRMQLFGGHINKYKGVGVEQLGEMKEEWDVKLEWHIDEKQCLRKE